MAPFPLPTCKFKLELELLRSRTVILYRESYRRRCASKHHFPPPPPSSSGKLDLRRISRVTRCERKSREGEEEEEFTDNCIASLTERSARAFTGEAISMHESRGEREGEGGRTKGSLLFSIRDDIWMESRVGLTGCRSIWARSLLRGYDFVVLAATNRALPRLLPLPTYDKQVLFSNTSSLSEHIPSVLPSFVQTKYIANPRVFIFHLVFSFLGRIALEGMLLNRTESV